MQKLLESCLIISVFSIALLLFGCTSLPSDNGRDVIIHPDQYYEQEVTVTTTWDSSPLVRGPFGPLGASLMSGIEGSYGYYFSESTQYIVLTINEEGRTVYLPVKHDQFYPGCWNNCHITGIIRKYPGCTCEVPASYGSNLPTELRYLADASQCVPFQATRGFPRVAYTTQGCLNGTQQDVYYLDVTQARMGDSSAFD